MKIIENITLTESDVILHNFKVLTTKKVELLIANNITIDGFLASDGVEYLHDISAPTEVINLNTILTSDGDLKLSFNNTELLIGKKDIFYLEEGEEILIQTKSLKNASQSCVYIFQHKPSEDEFAGRENESDWMDEPSSFD